ncbi:MAG: hypothetical protein IK990_06965 [Ruminiclostridium sp.]|nr:hypothetical protein [Ruminiclostridium sp.]
MKKGVPVIKEKNETTRKIRRYRNTLYITGSGISALGLWSALRVVLDVLISPQTLFTPEITEKFTGIVGVIVVLVILALVTAPLLGLYLFVGKKAREEGLGKKKNPLYIALILLLASLHIFSIIYCFIGLTGAISSLQDNIIGIIVSMIVDATAAVTLGEMCMSAVMIRVYEKKNTGN